ncbi:MAG: EF-hand domain-containing protein [Rubripirellula sp.]|nr:EF-hand domain-containing protein [Rubripirellula sp.]
MRPLIYSLLTLFLSAPLYAQSNSKGPDSLVVVGVLKSAHADQFQVLQSGEYLRSLVISQKSQIQYVGMPDKADHHPVPGYGVKARVEKNGSIKSILFTQPIGETMPLGDKRLAMSERELLTEVDADQDGKVSYVEFSRFVYHSPKHGPDSFRKNDKDGDGMLNQKEFMQSLKDVAWWTLSRKTPAEWIASADNNNNEKLSLEEFKVICTSGNHIDNVFRRTDKDKSGDLSVMEAIAYIKSITHKDLVR